MTNNYLTVTLTVNRIADRDARVEALHQQAHQLARFAELAKQDGDAADLALIREAQAETEELLYFYEVVAGS